MEVEVLAVSRWEMTENGQTMRGGKVVYIDRASREDDPKRKGFFPVEIACDYDLFASIPLAALPCRAQVAIGLKMQNVNGRMKPIGYLNDIELKLSAPAAKV